MTTENLAALFIAAAVGLVLGGVALAAFTTEAPLAVILYLAGVLLGIHGLFNVGQPSQT